MIWKTIVEERPKVGKVVLVEITANEYLDPERGHSKVIAAYLMESFGDYYWVTFNTFSLSPTLCLSSTHIWRHLPESSTEW
jgi:hypothetical protein